jgi:hypothetical protein
MAKIRDLGQVHKSGMFSRLSCTSVPTNSKFASLFKKIAESKDFDVNKVYQEDHFEGASLRNGSETDPPLSLVRAPTGW